ncbi:MAG: twin-arginine translocase subunit TatC [Candidatus Latescibacteria bacterium]|nr:twin-arginine translocase subunit TatC [Candidatus Latescibacterota bacterium]
MSDKEPPDAPHQLPEELATDNEVSSPSGMPFLDHLEELRWRLLKSLAAILVGAIVCLIFRDVLRDLLTAPYDEAVQSLESGQSSSVVLAAQQLLESWIGQTIAPADSTTAADTPADSLPYNRKLQAIKPLTWFLVDLQIALIGGFMLALPVIFFQFWRFVAPGLLNQEKRLFIPIVMLSVVCFAIGALIAYWIVLPLGLRFFLALEPPGMTTQWTIDSYLSFVMRLVLGFGLVFEMPVITLFLSRLGLLTPEYMRRVRRYAIIIIFVLAAFFTPPDPFSQVMMALPLLALYQISIWVCRLSSPKTAKAQEPATETPDKPS